MLGLSFGTWDLKLQHGEPSVVAHVLSSCGKASVDAAHKLSGCGTWAPERAGSVFVARRPSCSVTCGILVPWPGTEPAFPAHQGKFYTTGPPRESERVCVLYIYIYICDFIYLFLTVLGLHCCADFSFIAVSRSYHSCNMWASHFGGLSCYGAQAQ